MSQVASRRKTKPAASKAKNKTAAKTRNRKAAAKTSPSRTSSKGSATPNEAVRERIVAAALSLFARSGFDGATITQVARDAGVASPLIYYYFEDKDELWRAAADYAIRDWSQSVRNIEKELSDADPITILKVQLRRFIYFSSQHREFSRLIINEAGSGDGRMEWLIEHHIKPMHTASNKALENAMEVGLVRNVDPAFLNQFVIGGVAHFMNSGLMLNTVYGINPRDEKTVDEFADFLIDLLFDGLRTHKSK